MTKKIGNYLITHLHTRKGSVGDSILSNEELVKKAKELNMSAICMTDHGSLSNMYSFYYECIENDIQPIIGCEIYLCDDKSIKDKDHKKTYHLILIAKDKKGISNILKIVSDASINGYYYRPRTDLDYIKNHSEGLICTTACVGGYAPQLILNDKLNEATEHINQLKNIFENDLYLEIQPGNFEDQVKVNLALMEISKSLDIKLIAANDVHYLNKEDWKTHDFHVRIARKLKAPENPEDSIYVDKIYYMMTKEELIESFDYDLYNKDIVLDAIENTNEIQKKCKPYNFNEKGLNLPDFKCPMGYSPKTYIEHLCMERLNEIQYKIKNPSQYIDRIYNELDVIDELGFSSYFLITRDLIKKMESEDIKIGPGRGSVCGSIIAYLLGITKIDSIKYNLLFDRFLSVNRKGSIPDIDIDVVSGEGRDRMFEYTIETYGLKHCAAVSTYGIRKARSCIRSVCKLYDIDQSDEDRIAKLIPQSVYEETEDGSEKKTDLSIKESLETVNELKEWQNIYPEVFEMAMKLEGLPDHMSVHAAGTLIAKSVISDIAPMIRQENKNLNATALDLHDAESQRLVKYDYLGLNTLNIISECERLTGYKFDIEFDSYDDPKVWDLIGSRNTTGLFQIGSNTYKQRMSRLGPRTIEQLADCLALVRGPCIQSKLDEKYMQIVEKKQDVELIHPLYDSAVSETNGIMIYQEELMQCCANMGLPLHDGYKLMKASAKKKFDKIAEYEDILWKLVNNLMDKNTFDYIFKLILDSGKYSFNKSHAIAYATIAYCTAYYKTYHPKEFFAATLTCIYSNKSGKTDERKIKIQTILKECQRAGIKFLKLDINHSKYKFTVDKEGIRIGYCALASFSYRAYEEIKKCMPFTKESSIMQQIYDTTDKQACSSKAVNPLILSGAFGDNIVELYEEYYYLNAKKKNPDPPSYKVFIHRTLSIEVLATEDEIELGLFNANFIYNKYQDLMPLNFYAAKINSYINGEAYISKVTKRKYQGTKNMAILNFETSDGTIEALVFDNKFNDLKSLFKKDKKINFTGKKTQDDKIIINSIKGL